MTGAWDDPSVDWAAFATLRRELHAHPELAFQEHRTAERIASTLTGWGIPVHRGMGKTGVVGTIRKGTGSRAIGLRADMDALPIQEQNTFAHASTEPGRMHACGHDGHTVMLLAAAKRLSQEAAFDGTVHLIFQPAEEGGGGAREMIRDGLFERFPMDALFGVHNWPGMRAGQFAIESGPVFASGNRFRIVVRGKGTHAAMPHNGIDPVPIACQMVQAFQTILTRNKRPLDAAVLSVTMIRAGEAINAVSDSCEIRGTVRTFSPDVLELIETRMQRISEATCQAFEASCEFEFERYYPATVNAAAETEFVRAVLTGMVGGENVLKFEPTMGAEDFSFYLLEKPGCYFVMGNGVIGNGVIGNGDGDPRASGHAAGPCVLHSPSYDFNDALIPIGAAMWVQLVEAWFKRATA